MRAILAIVIFGIVGCSSSADKSTQSRANAGRMVFDGREYEISEAQISAVLLDPYRHDTGGRGGKRSEGESLSWSIRFETKKQEVDGEKISPHVDFDGLRNLKIANWHDLAGLSMSWSEPINDETGERYGLTYVWDHQLITKCNLRIKNREGTKFRVIATGENERGDSFSIDAPATFAGVRVDASGKDSDETVRARIAKQLSLANLKAGALEFRTDDKYEDGMKMGSAMFAPQE